MARTLHGITVDNKLGVQRASRQTGEKLQENVKIWITFIQIRYAKIHTEFSSRNKFTVQLRKLSVACQNILMDGHLLI